MRDAAAAASVLADDDNDRCSPPPGLPARQRSNRHPRSLSAVALPSGHMPQTGPAGANHVKAPPSLFGTDSHLIGFKQLTPKSRTASA